MFSGLYHTKPLNTITLPYYTVVAQQNRGTSIEHHLPIPYSFARLHHSSRLFVTERKESNSISTTGKLLSRSLKIAHALLHKTFTSKNNSGGPLAGDNSIKPSDRVALVYPNNDPINFICAFYGCLQAGVVPVPIEVPLTRRDAGLQQVGFLLGSCSVQYALTSDACLKGERLLFYMLMPSLLKCYHKLDNG